MKSEEYISTNVERVFYDMAREAAEPRPLSAEEKWKIAMADKRYGKTDKKTPGR